MDTAIKILSLFILLSISLFILVIAAHTISDWVVKALLRMDAEKKCREMQEKKDKT